MTEPLKKVLGAQVRDLRLARHLSQEGLAEELGVSTRYLAGIERGERNLSLDSIDALAEQLGVEARSLMAHRFARRVSWCDTASHWRPTHCSLAGSRYG